MNQEIIPYFEHGHLVKLNVQLENYYDSRELFYHARLIVSDGLYYNLENEESINGITILDYSLPELSSEFEDLGVTGDLWYVLERKATAMRKENRKSLAVALLKKAHDIIKAGEGSILKDDYMRLVHWLQEDGHFDEADAYKKEMEALCAVILPDTVPHFVNRNSASMFRTALQEAEQFGVDYIMACNEGACCEDCAKYRNRVYNISGKDKRFPRIPVYECDCDGVAFVAFFSEPTEEDIVRSNRPFIDDRDENEKMAYQYVLDRRHCEECTEKNHEKYNRLMQIIPQDMPKSFTAFQRMRNMNSEKFQTIADKALSFGIDIYMSDEEYTILERYKKYCKEHGYKK